MRRFALALLAVPLLTRSAQTLPPPSAIEIADLIRQLGNNSFQERRSAESKLEALGERACPALERAAKGSKDAQVRQRAALLAAKIEGLVTPKFVDYLRNAAWGNRPAEPEQVERAFAVMVRNGDQEMQREALRLLAELGPRHERFSRLLVQASNHDSQYVRIFALVELSRLRPPPGDGMAALLRASRDLDRDIAATAQDGIETVVAWAFKDFRVRGSKTRAAAVAALGEVGRGFPMAVPTLLEALQDNDPTVREAAAKALKQLDPEAAKRAGVK
jgi:HEAT repeat protein